MYEKILYEENMYLLRNGITAKFKTGLFKVLALALVCVLVCSAFPMIISNASTSNSQTKYENIADFQNNRWLSIENSVFGRNDTEIQSYDAVKEFTVAKGNDYFNWTETNLENKWDGTTTAPLPASSGTQEYNYSDVYDDAAESTTKSLTSNITYTVYNVSNPSDFYTVLYEYSRTANANTHIKLNLTSDLDFNAQNWTPISQGSNKKMTGSLYIEGNGHTLYNLKITGTTNIGMFGTLNKRLIIKNLGFKSSMLIASKGTGGRSGLIVGNAGRNSSTNSNGMMYFYNVHSDSAYMQSTDCKMGGLVGDGKYYGNTFFKNCSTSNYYMYGGDHIGSILAYTMVVDNPLVKYNAKFPDTPETFLYQENGVFPVFVENCYSVDCELFSTGADSGAFISCGCSISFRNCFTNDNIYSKYNTGGFIGRNAGAIDARPKKMFDDAGNRLITNYFENCYSSGIVEGGAAMGGFVGLDNTFRKLENIQNDTNGSSPYFSQPGYTPSTETGSVIYKDCYSTAMVGMDYAGKYVGGFIGMDENYTQGTTVKINGENVCANGSFYINCYAAGEVGNVLNQLTEAFKKDGLSGLIEEAGNIFGELATKAAEQAPKMVDVAVSFIVSFVDSLGKNANKIASAGVSIIETLIKGVSDNIGKLAKAAKSIVKALVDNLVKLLPNEVQKSVKECINTLTKSFENGGLKKAINTVKTIISNLCKIITNVAKVVLPPLAKAVDLVADNLNILLPIVVAVYTAYKSYQLISTITGIITAHTVAVTAESLAQAASLGTITLKQIAVGALTGEISLATAAQYAWNLAMSLNPIGIVVAAVAGLIAIITALNVCNSDILSSEEELKISKENLAKANEDLGNSYNGVADGLNNFESNIDSASSCLDGFDDSVIISKDKQQELADKMQNVQKQITDIATTATEERRNLNQNEIDRLDELFAKQKDLANQEQEVQQGRQKAVKDIAEDTAANHDMSLEEYEEYATKYIKSAEDERDATVDAAEKTKINVLAEKKALIGKSSEYTTEWYNKQREQAQKDYDKSVSEANKVCGDTLSVVKKGYEDRAGALKKYQKNQSDYAKKTEDEQDRHNGRLGILYHNMNDSLEKCQDESGKTQSEIQKKYQKLINEENAKYNNNISKSKKEFSKTIDKDQEHQLGYWIEILGHTETYGGKITKSDKQTVKDIDAIFDTLPKGTTQAMNNAMQGMIDNIEERSPELYAKIANQADTVLSIYKKHWDEHSPSKATKKIFKFLISGGELGFDEETPKLYKQTEKIADTIKDKLSNKISADFIVSKMRTAVSASQSALTSQLTANVVHDVNVQTAERDKKVIATGNIVTHMDVNGREFAVATTPYISEELAWEDR